MTQRAVIVGTALLAIVAGVVALLLGERMQRTHAAALAERLRGILPARLARWADAIAYGAVRTSPGDFPPDSAGDGLGAWAVFGAAIMDRESYGADGDGYTPRGEWNGTGDGGNALTPWQLDRRYHARYLGRGDRTPATDSEYAFGLLAERWRKFRSLDGAAASLAATAAAYNASTSRVVAAVEAKTDTLERIAAADSVTYGGDYGSDVLRRFGGFYT